MKNGVRTVKTYGTPRIEWPGFDGPGYKVDYSKVWRLPIGFGPKEVRISERLR